MIDTSANLFDKIRQQFDNIPYPGIQLEHSPHHDHYLIYIHNIMTPYYLRNQQIINDKDQVILDVGCGTGYKSLALAQANPEAKIIGIDISAESIEIAKQRLIYHGFKNAEFYVSGLEYLEKLGYQFNYINCDELLYLLPEPITALQAMKAVLKPDGIIRANLHSQTQRQPIFNAQKIFQMMGLMDNNPGEFEVEIVTEIMQALKDNVHLKKEAWIGKDYSEPRRKEKVVMNFLLQGDKGYNIPDMFAMLQASNLELISMVNWRSWDLMKLFQNPDNLPVFLEMSLSDIPIEIQLQLFELLNPVHRLLDFWCGHPNQTQSFTPISAWNDTDWQMATVHLHPTLKTSDFRESLLPCVRENRLFPISQYLSLIGEFFYIDSSTASCLVPLLEQPQTIMSLVERWQKIRPIDPITLETIDKGEAFEVVKKFMQILEDLGYIMLIKSN